MRERGREFALPEHCWVGAYIVHCIPVADLENQKQGYVPQKAPLKTVILEKHFGD